jgi:hypothetical protein
MFLFLKTSIDFNIMASPKGWLFEHLIGDTRSLRICPFGRIAIFALIFVLIMRNFITITPYLVNIFLELLIESKNEVTSRFADFQVLNLRLDV